MIIRPFSRHNDDRAATSDAGWRAPASEMTAWEVEGGDENMCENCGAKDVKLSRCGGCKVSRYCGRKCQTTHRPMHREACEACAAALKAVKHIAEADRELQSAALKQFQRTGLAGFERAERAYGSAVDHIKALGPVALPWLASALVDWSHAANAANEHGLRSLELARRAVAAIEDARERFPDPDRLPSRRPKWTLHAAAAVHYEEQDYFALWMRYLFASAKQRVCEQIIALEDPKQMLEADTDVQTAFFTFSELAATGSFDLAQLEDHMIQLMADRANSCSLIATFPTHYRDFRIYFGKTRRAIDGLFNLLRECAERNPDMLNWRKREMMACKAASDALRRIGDVEESGSYLTRFADVALDESKRGGPEAEVMRWTRVEMLMQAAHVFDGGFRRFGATGEDDAGTNRNSFLADAAAAARKDCIRALREVGRETEETCSICLDAMDVASGVDLEIFQGCYHVFHNRCLMKYVEGARLKALEAGGASCPCPKCKHAGNMQVRPAR